ncbi:tyrosine-type recombinase/integrase [Geoglobus acetivorans]|uniref:Phage integrase n=1 Tax=Geoglobus acetivorans TaxID=565033 RepID=A0A0A7GGJ8_GEOAI|nr:Phage integrase [Geoglobus acetivorans]
MRFKKHYPDEYDVIKEFSDDLLAEGLSELRIGSYVEYLKRIRDIAEGKKLTEFDKSDVRGVINHYQILCNRGDLSDSTVFEVKKTLKKFFKWLGKEELVSWFSLGNVENKLSPADLITEEEFKKMLSACQNSRDRAFLSLIYETGARIGEIGSMKIKDVIFDEYGAVVWFSLRNTSSKKHRRKLRVVFSAQYLAAWLKDHPLKDDPEAPLWVKLSGKNRLQHVEYNDIRAQLKRIAKRAGIKKRIYPHLFRHTRATRLLQQVPEIVGAKFMGWVPGTKMTRVYIHLADQDVENAILNLYGLKTENDSKDLEVRKCPRCDFINDAESRFCSRCGLPLNEDALKEVEEWERQKAEAMKLLSNPEFLAKFMSMMQEIEMIKQIYKELRKNAQVGRDDLQK